MYQVSNKHKNSSENSENSGGKLLAVGSMYKKIP